jgi:NCAIR mutase (PurE)-related protein
MYFEKNRSSQYRLIRQLLPEHVEPTDNILIRVIAAGTIDLPIVVEDFDVELLLSLSAIS